MDPMPGPADPNVGRVLKNTYRIEHLIGRGGMGAVYEARHTKISKRYAVKLLLPELNLTPSLRERFFREAEACSRIDHPNVVDIIDFDEAPQGELFMVMEMLEGVDIATRLATPDPIAPESLVRWFLEVCDAVAAAHRLGIVHRDLKPANLFLQRRGGRETVKVLDFGLAKFRAEAGLTTSGAMMGTPCYMAPEQIEGEGEAMGPPTDIFALGCILYELLVGHVAFSGKSIAQIAFKIVHGERPQLPAERTPALQPVIDRCLHQDPAARFQSAEELREAFLQGVAETEELPTVPVDAEGRPATLLPPITAAPPDREQPASSPPPASGAGPTLRDVGLDETQPVSGAVPPGAVDVTARTVAATGSGLDTGTESAPPAPTPGDEDLPDVGRYTTVGRLKRRKGTIGLVLLGVALAVAAAVLLPRWLRKGPTAHRAKPVARRVPDWAARVPAAQHTALSLAESPGRWHRLSLRAWEALADALEKAHQQAELPPAQLEQLQTRMYVARAQVHLLHGRLDRADELAAQALRKAGDGSDATTRRMATLSSAWVWIHRDAPDAARDRLRALGKDSGSAVLTARAATNLMMGDMATAMSRARQATRLDPQDPEAWLVLSLAAEARGQRIVAERAAAEALAEAPAWPPARIRFATLLRHRAARRAVALALCAPRKADAPLYRAALAACHTRINVVGALDVPDRFHQQQVLRHINPRLSDAGLLAAAPLLVAAPGLPPVSLGRLATLSAGTAQAPPTPHLQLVAAVVALLRGDLNSARAHATAAGRSGRWLYRVRLLEAEIAVRAGQNGVARKKYEAAARAAQRAGIGGPGGAPHPGAGQGDCDAKAPVASDHAVIRARLLRLREVGRAEPPGGGRALDPDAFVALSAIVAAEPVL